MTDSPKVGFLCTGKTPLELAVSVHCSHKMTEILRTAGYMPGACYTEILDGATVSRVKHAGKTLEHLSRAVDLVITVGCEGFAPGDDIPELTDVVCDKKAAYFTAALCGAESVYTTDPRYLQTARTSNSPSQTAFIGASDFSARAFRRSGTQNGAISAFTAHAFLSDIRKEPLSARLNRILERFGASATDEDENKDGSLPADCSAVGEPKNSAEDEQSCAAVMESVRTALRQEGSDGTSPVTPRSRITDAAVLRIFSGMPRRSGKPVFSDESRKSIRSESIAAARSIPFPGESGSAAAVGTLPASSSADRSESPKERARIHLPPSRAHAGIAGKTLVLNFSNDVATALPLLSALLPAIHFSVYNLCGKSAVTTAEFNEKLKKLADLDGFVENKRVINK